MNKISVIIPVYNAENTIDRCLDSVTKQTFGNLEIILIDDGSQDNSKEKYQEWAKKDNRIKIITQKNRGVSAARNAGINIATGDYIAFVDSDDWIDSTMYEKLLKKANMRTMSL